ncbi:aspartic peptidase domain-containing protein [Halteromyces radiatus]|uniref:aspartic peptidase domain-containing protein n=1 Tax=Halteromyces radiatus TaxID=101107 RepID=UPI0022204048|nr:aspartic peptidase domain-containing protein [Halteromyces radiatus]KAI8097384.1 aspartic peptidase domain-containing protein [Halteromyces radiatus]
MRFSISLVSVASAIMLTVQGAPSTVEDKSYTMVLEQRVGKVWNTPARVNHVLAKYGIMDDETKLDAAAEVELESAFVDVEYLGKIGVGTPPQYFNMDLDTGSADIWIPAKECPTCGNRQLFDSAASSTFENVNKTWSLRYADGSSVIGLTARDTVEVGDVKHANQIIGLAHTETEDFARDQNLDGIFGLAFPSLSFTGQKQSIVESMYEAGEIEQPIVGIYLGRVRDGGKGEAKFGGVNQNHFTGEIKYLPVTQKKYWQVEFGGIEINGNTTTGGASQAIIDTGTTLTVLPPALSKAFHDAIPGATFSRLYGWQVPCKLQNGGTITFKLGGQDFPVPLGDMIRERSTPNNPSLCFSGVAEANSPLIIMGDTFLRNYYSVYDFKNAQVGLAPSKA